MGNNLKNNMKYIVYITTNVKNNKIYVGVHKTENPDVFDGYIGCGVNIYRPSSYKKSKTPFQFAVNKYGVDCFKRSLIKVFNTLDEALNLEFHIVDEEFIKRRDTYNVALGGGLIPLTNKQTYQYDFDGNFIKEFKSKVDASEFYSVNPSLIGNAIIYKTTSCGYLWSYDKYDKLDITNYNIYNIDQSVYKYLETGELSEVYLSITEAANSANTTTSNIQRAIKGSYKINNFYYSLELLTKFIPKETISIKGKKLYAYSVTGEFVKEFNSPSDAVKELGIKSSSSITSAMRTGRCCGNFQWSLEKVPYMKEVIPDKPKKVKIAQYSLDGEFIKEFETMTQAKKEFGSGVQKAIDGKISNYKGFVLKRLS